MSFSKELFKGVSEDFISPFGFSATIINGTAIYVDGFKKILSFSISEVLFETKKHKLKVIGENLFIKKMEEFSCVIVGKIGGFYVE